MIGGMEQESQCVHDYVRMPAEACVGVARNRSWWMCLKCKLSEYRNND